MRALWLPFHAGAVVTGRERRMSRKDHKHPLSYEDPSGHCDCDEAFALIEETVKQLRAELETVEKERNEALETAEAAIIADLRDSANRWADFRHPSPSVDARNRSIAVALRKAANRFERGEHRKDGEE